jgi:hypothetical protein
MDQQGKEKKATYPVLHQPRLPGTRLGLALADHIPRRLGLDSHLVWAGCVAPGLGEVGDDASVEVAPRKAINQSLPFINITVGESGTYEVTCWVEAKWPSRPPIWPTQSVREMV